MLQQQASANHTEGLLKERSQQNRCTGQMNKPHSNQRRCLHFDRRRLMEFEPLKTTTQHTHHI